MLLIDTSVWVDHLRDADTTTAHELRALLRSNVAELATTEPIIMELLAGAPSEHALQQLEALTNGLALLSVNNHRDYHDAATLYRTARRNGKTIRKLVDCLIAAVAIRTEATLIHNDKDFDVIAEISPLRTRRAGGINGTTP